MNERRTYAQHCGVARALDVIGERWTLLLVRELLLGPVRYGDLLQRLDGITTNLLAKRLKELTSAGVLERTKLPSPASGEAYALTEAGRALEPVIMELGRWGGRYLLEPRRGDRRNIGWGMLSMKRRYVGGADFVAEVRAGARTFELTLLPERLEVRERPSERASVRLATADDTAMFELFFGLAPFEHLERAGRLAVTGDRLRIAELLAALPPPAMPGRAPTQKGVLGRA